MQTININEHGVAGLVWITGWMFTIGFLHLTFWRGLWALIVWPYYLGSFIATLHR